MKFLKALILFLILMPLTGTSQNKTSNVVLITLDGFRWQELFGGAVDTLMNDLTFVKDTAELQRLFGGSTPIERREKLLPWFWSEIGKKGQVYGNKWHGNNVNCSNPHWFSYPGYNEILVGYSDPYVDSNEKKYNQNETVLEWLHKKEEFAGKVAAFGSWDVFNYIINDKRSGIPVNAGYENATGEFLTCKEQTLNEIQIQFLSPWSGTRYDAFTHHYALEYMKKNHPRVLYISYGETDDFAHDGKYDRYLKSAHQTDLFLQEIWNYLQKDDFYRGKTTLLISTDHGRGSSPKAEWKSHGKIYEGSPAIWIAALGPDTPAIGEVKEKGQRFQNQIAKTLAHFLNYEYVSKQEVGGCIEEMYKP